MRRAPSTLAPALHSRLHHWHPLRSQEGLPRPEVLLGHSKHRRHQVQNDACERRSMQSPVACFLSHEP